MDCVLECALEVQTALGQSLCTSPALPFALWFASKREQFKDCYNLQPLSTCHVVIYGTDLDSPIPQRSSSLRLNQWQQDDVHFCSFAPSLFLLFHRERFVVSDFGRFGYHTVIIAIQLYNRIKTLRFFFRCYIFFFLLSVDILCAAQSRFSRRCSIASLSSVLCPSASIFVESFV